MNPTDPVEAPIGGAKHQQFPREAQLLVVAISHFTIFVTVASVRAGFGVGEGLPWVFMLIEAIIVIACLAGVVATHQAAGSIREFFVGGFSWPAMLPRVTSSQAAGVILLTAFGLQFGALVPLLLQTGGPIDSPFAQLAVAFAIFTPFVANRYLTIWFVLAASVTFYAVFVKLVGFHSELEHRPSEWSYFSVNALVLFLAVLLTVADRRSRTRVI